MKTYVMKCKHCSKPLARLIEYERCLETSAFDDKTFLFLYCKTCKESTYFAYEEYDDK